jgi:hypothetical protein
VEKVDGVEEEEVEEVKVMDEEEQEEAIYLQRVGGHVGLRDEPEHLHPLPEHLPGDQVQWQRVLRQREVDLQDLLLHADGLLAVVRHQLRDDAVDLREQQVHGLPQGAALVSLLVLVVLDELVESQQRAEPAGGVGALQVQRDLVHHLRQGTEEEEEGEMEEQNNKDQD